MDEHITAQHAGHAASAGGHEQRDVTFRPIVWAGTGTAVVIVLIFGLVRWTYVSYFAREAVESPPANPLTSSYGRRLPPPRPDLCYEDREGRRHGNPQLFSVD